MNYLSISDFKVPQLEGSVWNPMIVNSVCLSKAFYSLNPLFRSHRILVRAISYTVHGLIPASCVFADRYNREEVVRSLGKEVNINPPLMLGQLPDTPEELLKLDQVSYFIESLIYH